MNGTNEVYRKGLNKVDQSSEEYEERQQLEEQHQAVMDKYKYKKRQIKELQEDLEAMQRTLSTLGDDEDQFLGVFKEKQVCLAMQLQYLFKFSPLRSFTTLGPMFKGNRNIGIVTSYLVIFIKWVWWHSYRHCCYN
jgi:predicted  nucleic acid-binding Zn-ribbon protein